MPKSWICIVTAVLISPLAISCATTKKEDVLPQDGPSMRALYDAHFDKLRQRQAHQVREQLGSRLAADTSRSVRLSKAGLKDEAEPNSMGTAATFTDDSDVNTPATLDHGVSDINLKELVKTAKNSKVSNEVGDSGYDVNSVREVDLSDYTRRSSNEIQGLFPRLPNPDLVMYVFPHLAGPEAVAVPGYATTFPMYEHIEYALPGEVPSR